MTTLVDEKVKVVFKKSTLDLISELADINPSLKFKKDEVSNEIYINGKDGGATIAYQFRGPVQDFNFLGEDCTFDSYTEFHDLLSVYEDPDIEQDGHDFVIKQNRSKTTFRLGNPEIVAAFKKVVFVDADTVVKLNQDEIKKINMMIGHIKADVIRLSIQGNEITVTLLSDRHDNTFEEVYDVENLTGEDFSLDISKEIFSKAPKGDYEISIKEAGIVRLSLLLEDNVTVDLYTGALID